MCQSVHVRLKCIRLFPIKSCLLYNARNIARQHRIPPAQYSGYGQVTLSDKFFLAFFGGFVITVLLQDKN
jgi:hypothetical protein